MAVKANKFIIFVNFRSAVKALYCSFNNYFITLFKYIVVGEIATIEVFATIYLNRAGCSIRKVVGDIIS